MDRSVDFGLVAKKRWVVGLECEHFANRTLYAFAAALEVVGFQFWLEMQRSWTRLFHWLDDLEHLVKLMLLFVIQNLQRGNQIRGVQ